MATIFHLTTGSEWAAAQSAGSYTGSTRGRTLAEEGFIHCARGDQWPGVRERYYADVTEPLVLLKIDTDALDVPVVEEPGEPGGTETFPHIYGPLPVAAVGQAIPLDRTEVAARPPAPAGAASAAGAGVDPGARRAAGATPANPSAETQDKFGTIFFREMFRNALVLVVLCAAVMGGSFLGHAIRDDGWGAIGGLVVGAVVGVPLALQVRKRVSADE